MSRQARKLSSKDMQRNITKTAPSPMCPQCVSYFTRDLRGYRVMLKDWESELKTTGIVSFDYYEVENGHMINNINYSFMQIDGITITENAIRKENGLPIRIAH